MILNYLKLKTISIFDLQRKVSVAIFVFLFEYVLFAILTVDVIKYIAEIKIIPHLNLFQPNIYINVNIFLL